MSTGHRRYNQPFNPTVYGPSYVQGDVIGVGYRPRSGTIFFTRNGKKLEDVAHGLKLPNFFPSVGADGPCQVHVNFGQLGFVFIEANVKKWGLAPMTGSLAPPPPYGSEQGSILLEGGREGVREGMGLQGYLAAQSANYGWPHVITPHQRIRLSTGRHPTSPGPQRSPTDISLAQLSLIDPDEDVGEGTSAAANAIPTPSAPGVTAADVPRAIDLGMPPDALPEYPPEYESPAASVDMAFEHERREAEITRQSEVEISSSDSSRRQSEESERHPMIRRQSDEEQARSRSR